MFCYRATWARRSRGDQGEGCASDQCKLHKVATHREKHATCDFTEIAQRRHEPLAQCPPSALFNGDRSRVDVDVGPFHHRHEGEVLHQREIVEDQVLFGHLEVVHGPCAHVDACAEAA